MLDHVHKKCVIKYLPCSHADHHCNHENFRLVLNRTLQSVYITIITIFFSSKRFLVTINRLRGTCISKPTSTTTLFHGAATWSWEPIPKMTTNRFGLLIGLLILFYYYFFSHKEHLYLFPHTEHYLQITYSTYSTELTLMTLRYLIYFQKSIYTTYNTQYTKYTKH